MAGETATAGVSGAGRNSRTDMVSMITQLAPMLFGSGKQTVSETSGKNISPEQLQALMSNMASSSSGLASVLMPQRQVGLYNSPVNSLLSKQLMTQIAGKAAEIGTPIPTTRTTQTARSPAAGPAAGLMGLLEAGSMAKSAWKEKDAIAKFLGLGEGEKDMTGFMDKGLIDVTRTNWPAAEDPVMSGIADYINGTSAPTSLGSALGFDSFAEAVPLFANPSIGNLGSVVSALTDASTAATAAGEVGGAAEAGATFLEDILSWFK